MRKFSKAQQIILLAIGLTVLTLNPFTPLHGPFSFCSTSESQPHEQYAVEITGPVRRAGIYTFNNPPTPCEAIQRAGGLVGDRSVPFETQPEKMETGMRIEADRFTLSRMNVRERIVLGIPVDLNQAGADELVLIPGISHGLAQRIVGVRETVGCFRTWNDLRSVKGVGPANIKRFQDYIDLSEFRTS
jgi:competence protein ComEA